MGEVIRKTKNGRVLGWYIRWVDLDGKRKTRASKQPTFAEAKRMLVEIEARVARGKLGVSDPPQRITIGALLERFFTEYDPPKARDRGRWEHKAREQLATLIPQLADRQATSFSAEDGERLRNQLLRGGLKSNTVRLKLTFLGTAFGWAVKKGLLRSSPLAELRKPRAESRCEYLSGDEVRLLLAAVDAPSGARVENETRQQVLAIAVRLAIYAGLRVGEVFGLRWRDVDLQTGLLTISRSYGFCTKSGKSRHVPIADELHEALRAWQPRCPVTREGVVCPVVADGSRSIWHAVERRRPELAPLYASAGIPTPASPWHALRHTFASHFLMSGGGLLTLQKLLGHNDLKVTSVYAHLSSEHVAAEVRRLSFAKR